MKLRYLYLAVWCAVPLLLFASGCGSDNPPGSPAQGKGAANLAAKKTPDVPKALQTVKKRRELENSQLKEISPPGKAGELGMTAEQVAGLRPNSSQAKVPPELVEVVPPNKSGEHGITAMELEAKRVAVSQKKVDPQQIEVSPPGKGGEKGLTAGQMERLRASRSQEKIDPDRIEVFPPSKPGERGMSAAEVQALQSSTPRETNLQPLEAITPKSGATTKKPK